MKQSWFLLDILLALAALGSVALFWSNNLVLSLILISIAAFQMALKKSISEFILFICIAIAAPFAESVAIYFGAWKYTNPNFLFIPIWLTVLWGIAGIFCKRMWEVIEEMIKN